MGRAAWIILLTSAALLVADALTRSHPAVAEAALAVGLPADVAKQGVAMGWALNYPTKAAAQAEALKRCRGYRDAPEATRDLCKVVETFAKTCLAVAWDPDNFTTGLGWAVHKSQQQAEDLAMDACMETSDTKRRAFCRVSVTRCDGKN